MAPYPSPGKDSEYFSFVPSKNSSGPLMSVVSNPEGNKLFGVMADFSLLLANRSNNPIIDEILFDDALKPYLEKLSEHTVYFVGVKCDLHVMQEREFLRRDRALGLASDQIDGVRNGTREYDLTVDTSNAPVFKIASEILDFIKLEQCPKGFINMREKLC